MESRKFERLVTVMALLAGGDKAALFMLYDEFGEHVAAAVTRELRRLNTRVSSDDFGGIVIDAVLALGDCAGAWDPARGALPWVWAEKRVRTVVSRHVGQYADSIDEPESKALRAFEQEMAAGAVPAYGEASSDTGASELEALVHLASSEEACKLLLAALEEVTTPRDREILLAYKVQASLGDPSPAHTIGAAFGLKPATVRQVVKRGLDRLRRLAAADARFAAIADLRFLT